MNRYINNVFTLGVLLNPCDAELIRFENLTLEQAREWVSNGDWTSAMGHADTANMASNELGVEIPYNRVSLKIVQGDELLVTQYIGPRLDEGVITLPEGAKIQYYRVFVKNRSEQE